MDFPTKVGITLRRLYRDRAAKTVRKTCFLDYCAKQPPSVVSAEKNKGVSHLRCVYIYMRARSLRTIADIIVGCGGGKTTNIE